jgi:uncharacterized membrane protein
MIYDPLHISNIVTHVVAGSLAMLCGAVTLLTTKGGRWHRQSGRIFLYLLAVVVMTGLFGVFIFKRNVFLLVITLLSGYLGYSGFRIVKLKNNRPHIADIAAAIITLSVPANKTTVNTVIQASTLQDVGISGGGTVYLSVYVEPVSDKSVYASVVTGQNVYTALSASPVAASALVP